MSGNERTCTEERKEQFSCDNGVDERTQQRPLVSGDFRGATTVTPDSGVGDSPQFSTALPGGQNGECAFEEQQAAVCGQEQCGQTQNMAPQMVQGVVPVTQNVVCVPQFQRNGVTYYGPAAVEKQQSQYMVETIQQWPAQVDGVMDGTHGVQSDISETQCCDPVEHAVGPPPGQLMVPPQPISVYGIAQPAYNQQAFMQPQVPYFPVGLPYQPIIESGCSAVALQRNAAVYIPPMAIPSPSAVQAEQPCFPVYPQAMAPMVANEQQGHVFTQMASQTQNEIAYGANVNFPAQVRKFTAFTNQVAYGRASDNLAASASQVPVPLISSSVGECRNDVSLPSLSRNSTTVPVGRFNQTGSLSSSGSFRKTELYAQPERSTVARQDSRLSLSSTNPVNVANNTPNATVSNVAPSAMPSLNVQQPTLGSEIAPGVVSTGHFAPQQFAVNAGRSGSLGSGAPAYVPQTFTPIQLQQTVQPNSAIASPLILDDGRLTYPINRQVPFVQTARPLLMSNAPSAQPAVVTTQPFVTPQTAQLARSVPRYAPPLFVPQRFVRPPVVSYAPTSVVSGVSNGYAPLHLPTIRLTASSHLSGAQNKSNLISLTATPPTTSGEVPRTTRKKPATTLKYVGTEHDTDLPPQTARSREASNDRSEATLTPATSAVEEPTHIPGLMDKMVPKPAGLDMVTSALQAKLVLGKVNEKKNCEEEQPSRDEPHSSVSQKEQMNVVEGEQIGQRKQTPADSQAKAKSSAQSGLPVDQSRKNELSEVPLMKGENDERKERSQAKPLQSTFVDEQKRMLANERNPRGYGRGIGIISRASLTARKEKWENYAEEGLSPVVNPASGYVECAYCKAHKEDPEFYRSHRMRDANGRTTCPRLQKLVCVVCRATGEDAHTLHFCPKRAQQPQPVLSNDVRTSSEYQTSLDNFGGAPNWAYRPQESRMLRYHQDGAGFSRLSADGIGASSRSAMPPRSRDGFGGQRRRGPHIPNLK